MSDKAEVIPVEIGDTWVRDEDDISVEITSIRGDKASVDIFSHGEFMRFGYASIDRLPMNHTLDRRADSRPKCGECVVSVRALRRLYGCGYKAGHNDTVESVYTDVLDSEMEFYHKEEVREFLEENDIDCGHEIQRGE
jgi:hypothetical protein